MARRNRTSAPPIPKPPKPQRPQGKALRELYKGLVTLSTSNRINSLASALQWFDSAQVWMLSRNKGQPLDPKIVRAIEIAVKSRKVGISATMEGEKETAFLMSVRNYEKACSIVKPVSVDKYYTELEAKKQKLEQRQQVAANQYGNLLSELAVAGGGEVRMLVFDGPKTRQLVPSSFEIIYNREGAKQVVETIKRQGMLSAFVAELDMMSRCLAFESNGVGGFQVNAEKYIAAQSRLMKNFVKHYGTMPNANRLVRPGATAEHGLIQQPQPASTQPKAPRQGAPQRTPIRRSSAPKVAGRYDAASTMALLYNKLRDGHLHKITDILQGVPAADPKGRLVNLGKDVKRFNWGTFEWLGDGVRMILTQEQAAV